MRSSGRMAHDKNSLRISAKAARIFLQPHYSAPYVLSTARPAMRGCEAIRRVDPYHSVPREESWHVVVDDARYGTSFTRYVPSAMQEHNHGNEATGRMLGGKHVQQVPFVGTICQIPLRDDAGPWCPLLKRNVQGIGAFEYVLVEDRADAAEFRMDPLRFVHGCGVRRVHGGG